MASDDPYGPRGKEFWADFAARNGMSVDSLAVLFTAAKERGESNAQAARSAGAKGAANAAGFRLSKSNQVARLMAALNAETGSEIGNVDARRARAILSRLAEGSDPAIRIRAIESLRRLDDRERGNTDYPDFEPATTARRLCEAAGAYGALAAVGIYVQQAKTAYGMPLGDKILPLVKREFPEALARILASLPPGSVHHQPEIEAMASGPIVPIGSFVPDGATTAKANGHPVTNGAAQQASAEQTESGSGGLTFNTDQKEWTR